MDQESVVKTIINALDAVGYRVLRGTNKNNVGDDFVFAFGVGTPPEERIQITISAPIFAD